MINARVLKTRMEQLGDIALIIGSLKSIALLESQQARGCVESQAEGLNAMQRAIVRSIAGCPELSLPVPVTPSILLILGSERGFCGNFNARLCDELDALTEAGTVSNCQIYPVGYRLSVKLEHDPRVVSALKAASVFAEIDTVLTALTSLVSQPETQITPEQVAVLYHDGVSATPRFEPLLGSLATQYREAGEGMRPLLNLNPVAFYAQAMSEYILTRLSHLLTLSFFSENQARLQHLENALSNLDEQTLTLEKQRNHLRQEQITEELETILLSAGLKSGEKS
ncbi:F0F1 ATP synthase subunit gamma [Aestuariibacter halophilus]|uniref:F0F1 ATP synthase subunit gamma n=1 Tax=Fluctibacter halophilus TaxID=226011 RepID=A0ABS8G8S5_9ALTE|nr:F0F1 ATP synthase subunit gamma [Aestuariibacter halophilus]MCC2616864.1 F0F1 ATP synthase subunit gamma [Aestuariibacter halophilus]